LPKSALEFQPNQLLPAQSTPISLNFHVYFMSEIDYPDFEFSSGSRYSKTDMEERDVSKGFGVSDTDFHKYEGGLENGLWSGNGILICYPREPTPGTMCHYEGGFKDGTMHGFGTAWYFSGNSSFVTCYSGGWDKGRWNGYGTATYSNGSYYTGGFRDGRPDGNGTFTRADGSEYD